MPAIWSRLGTNVQPLLGALASIPGMRKAPQPSRAPIPFAPRSETPRQEIETLLEELHEYKGSWASQSCEQRAAVLACIISNTVNVAPLLASDCAQAKGSYGSGPGEELSGLIPVVMMMVGYLDALRANGAPAALEWRTRSNGQKVAQVFPPGLLGMLFGNIRGEVWIQTGAETSQGKLYREKEQAGQGASHRGGVSVVLGAGNQVSVVLSDVLHQLLVADQVVLLKLNPVNEYIGPHIQQILQPLIQEGWLRIVYGGKEVGQYLTSPSCTAVDSIHLTGSAATYNSVVWGAPVAPSSGQRLLTKPITAELGNVTPCIVVPPPPGTNWTPYEMQFQASNIAAGLLHNCGHNCISIEVLVTPQDWPQRSEFLAVLRRTLDAGPRRHLWYPGSVERMQAFKDSFPAASVQELGQLDPAVGEAASPILLAHGLSPSQARGDTESWGTALQEVVLPGSGSDLTAFLTAAADYVNDRLMGSLACSVIAHPASIAAVGEETFDDFIGRLRYGTVAVNLPPIMGFAFPSLTWGAWNGGDASARDIGSGVGFTHNTFMYDHPEKSVAWGTWSFTPRPFWWADNNNLEQISLQSLQVCAEGGASIQPKSVLSTLYLLSCINSLALEAIRG